MDIKILKNEHGTFTNNPKTGETAEEAYQVYLKQLENKIDICPKQTVEEKIIILEKTIANLEIELLEIK